MQRRIIDLPVALFRMVDVGWSIDWREQSAGTGTGGRQSINMGRLPRWIASTPLVIPRSLIGDVRARVTFGQGRLAVYKIRMIDPAVNYFGPGSALPFGDGAAFADGAGFANFPVAVCPDGAALGATEVTLNEVGLSASVAVGQILSFDDLPFVVSWRESLDGGLVRLGIQMPIRSAIPAGGMVELVGRGLFENVATAPVVGYGLQRIASPVFNLQEWLR